MYVPALRRFMLLYLNQERESFRHGDGFACCHLKLQLRYHDIVVNLAVNADLFRFAGLFRFHVVKSIVTRPRVLCQVFWVYVYCCVALSVQQELFPQIS